MKMELLLSTALMTSWIVLWTCSGTFWTICFTTRLSPIHLSIYWNQKFPLINSFLLNAVAFLTKLAVLRSAKAQKSPTVPLVVLAVHLTPALGNFVPWPQHPLMLSWPGISRWSPYLWVDWTWFEVLTQGHLCRGSTGLIRCWLLEI